MSSVIAVDSFTQEQDRQFAAAADILTDAALGNALMRQLDAKWQARPETVAPIDPEFSRGYDDGRGGRPQAGQGSEYVSGWLAGQRTNRRVGVR